MRMNSAVHTGRPGPPARRLAAFLAAYLLALAGTSAASAAPKTTLRLRLQTDDGTTPCDFFELLLNVDPVLGRCGASSIMMPRLDGSIHSLWAESVRFRDGDLTGAAIFQTTWSGARAKTAYRIELRATETDGTLSGTFKAVVATDRESQTITGRLGGEVTPADAPPEPGTELAPGTDWPCWRGPFSNGAAKDSGNKLVESMGKARLVWLSDEQIPNSYGYDARGAKASRLEAVNQGGYAAPIVLGNRVILYYFTPGGQWAKERWHMARRHDGRLSRDWGIMADDVFHCFDARTGHTLWKTVFKETAVSMTSFSKAGGLLAHSSANGKVYAVGPGGGVFCVDAENGEPLWQSNLGARAESQKHGGALLRKRRHVMYLNRDFGSAVCIADGILVSNDYLSHYVGPRWHDCGLVAFDGETGRRLWHYRNSSGWHDCPLTWRHGGKEYVIITTGREGASCIEPRTGKVLWTLPGARGRHVLTENMMVAAGPEGLTAWRITPERAEQAWVLKGTGNPAGFSAAYGGHLYTVSENAYLCVDMANGEIRGRHGSRRNTFMSFVVADGRVIHGLFMLNADPGNFLPMGSLSLAYANSTTPAYSDGRLFFRTPRRLACLDLRSSVRSRGVQPDPDLLLRVIAGDRGELHKAAAEGLKRSGLAAVPAVAEACGGAVRKNDFGRFTVFSGVLASLGAEGRRAGTPAWLQAMQGRSQEFFGAACDVFFRGGKVREQQALPLLVKAAAGGPPEIQASAIEVLLALEEDARQQAKPGLLAGLEKNDPAKWPAVATALLEIDPTLGERVMRRMTVTLAAKSASATAAALAILGEHAAKAAKGPARAHVMDSLAGVFSKRNTRHMTLAASALGTFGAQAKGSIPAMEKAFFDVESKALREAIRESVEQIQPGRKLKLNVDAITPDTTADDDLGVGDL